MGQINLKVKIQRRFVSLDNRQYNNHSLRQWVFVVSFVFSLFFFVYHYFDCLTTRFIHINYSKYNDKFVFDCLIARFYTQFSFIFFTLMVSCSAVPPNTSCSFRNPHNYILSWSIYTHISHHICLYLSFIVFILTSFVSVFTLVSFLSIKHTLI